MITSDETLFLGTMNAAGQYDSKDNFVALHFPNRRIHALREIYEAWLSEVADTLAQYVNRVLVTTSTIQHSTSIGFFTTQSAKWLAEMVKPNIKSTHAKLFYSCNTITGNQSRFRFITKEFSDTTNTTIFDGSPAEMIRQLQA